MHESDWDYAEFWRIIQIGVIKEESHRTYTKKSEDQEQKQRCGNEQSVQGE